MTETKRIVVVSDLHVGDALALWPVDREKDNSDSRPVRNWIRDQWAEFSGPWLRSVTKGEPFMLVVNGDAVQGNWSKFGPLMAKSMLVQGLAAVEILKPLAEAASAVVFVEGTEVHVGDDEDEIAELVHTLGSIAPEKMRWAAPGRLSHQFARISMNGLTHIFRHHTGVAGRAWTEATAQANHLADDRLRRLRNGHTPTDVLIAAHRHVYGYTSTMDGCSIVTPSWQGVGRWARAKTREDVPTVGAVVLDYSNCEHGEHPHVRRFVRSFPEPEAVAVA